MKRLLTELLLNYKTTKPISKNKNKADIISAYIQTCEEVERLKEEKIILFLLVGTLTLITIL